MIFFTPMPLSISMFGIASIWNRYSLPLRRAESPVHISLGPRMATSMPARLQQLGHRLRDLLVLVVEAAGAADPVEVLGCQRLAGIDDRDVEALGPVAALALVHAPRVALVLHRAVGVAELGGEVALHQRQVAPHVEDLVEDLDVDRADLVARLAARARPDLLGGDPLEHRVGRDRDLGVDADRRADVAVRAAVAAITSPIFSTISRGSSGLPVACAGHTLVQRPHIVQASVSSSCFHVKSSTTDAPNDLQRRLGEVRHRLHRALRAARGPCRYMFSGDVNMWRSIVIGRIARKTMNATTCATHAIWCHSVEGVGATCRRTAAQRVADEAPLLVARLARTAAMRNASARKPVRPITRNMPRMTACSGLVLMRMRYGRCT